MVAKSKKKKTPAKAPQDRGLGPIFSLQLTEEQHAWVEAQRTPGEGRSLVIRRIVQEAMEASE